MLDKTFDPKSVEPRLYARWEDAGAFRPEQALARDPDAQPFCMVIPPPNVTGSLHIGHALNNTLQDILARFHRMRGAAVLWLPGTDHAGIATQMVVERNLAAEGNISRREMGREEFIEKVWAWKAQSGGTITRQLRRLGASCDWSRERFTLDEGLSAAVRKVFVELYDKKLIYRDKRLVNWDPHFQTAISDLEVEQREQDGFYWRFAYPLEDGVTYRHPVAFDEDGRATEWETRDFIEVATTRPETMLGDTAVAVHPDDARYRELVGKTVRLPVVGRSIPIVADAYADPAKGSGAVKITPAHDFNDFQVAKRHGLAAINILDPFGKLAGPVPDAYQGMDRFAGRKAVVAEMEGLGLLRGIDPTRHVVPHGDRSGVVIEPYLTDQWYVDAKVLAEPAIAAVEDGRTVFEPKNWEKTYFEWMRNIEPWCISRQLWWGHRIPAWYGPTKWEDTPKDSGPWHMPDRETYLTYDRNHPKIFVGETERDIINQAVEYYGPQLDFGGDDWWNKGGRAHGPRATTPVQLRQDEDVLDTWFSSALWPFSTLGWPAETDDLKRFYPTSTLVTGFDIIFFWVARMMMMGLQFQGEVPFRRVVINGLVRDERGQKMSKSKGNVIDPLEVIDELGADALRFTMAILSGARDIKLSKSRIEGYRNFGTKLWNAARFCQMNECVAQADFDPALAGETLNRWIRSELTRTAQAVTRALEDAQFDQAATTLYRFVWNVFCDWYLELAKPVLNGDEGRSKAETRAMAAYVLDQTLKLLHPISPFVTEELWDQLAEFGPARETLLIEAPWPELPESWIDPAAQAEIDWVIALVSEVRSVRAEMNVPPSARPPLTLVSPDAETRERARRNRERLCSLARVDAVREAEAAPAGAVVLVAGGATAALSVAEFIDLAAERARLEKGVATGEQDVARVSKKLANPDFVARAKPEVVEAEREKLAEAEATLAKLKAALARLEGMS